MPRQPPLHSAIQVVGHAAQQGLFDLLPGATRRDRPAQPALADRDARLDLPPLAIGLTGKGPWPLAASRARGHAPRWPSRHRRHAALEAQVFAPPAVVGLRII